ncbi:hypothetical protein OBBRIDRAFT_800464 [Obba rivulosa]|uniref:Uncharacterized protein n=1 Tax=Obba rivulosa TaxID=1052685 RepID=A0A8E2J6D1_9APHY|nr:hypothetical protein OBBRIDRAFT_800464 [Obba rivulosa]
MAPRACCQNTSGRSIPMTSSLALIFVEYVGVTIFRAKHLSFQCALSLANSSRGTDAVRGKWLAHPERESGRGFGRRRVRKVAGNMQNNLSLRYTAQAEAIRDVRETMFAYKVKKP